MYKPLIGNTERKIKNVKGKNQIKLRKNKQRESRIKVLKLGLLISTVFLIVIFFLLKVVYGQGPLQYH